jgi:hypothetical protein
MKQITVNRAFWMAAVVFMCAYFGMVFKFTLNIPWEDDFPVLQSFLVDFVQADDFSEKFKLLIGGYGPHRLLLTRLIVLVVYAFCGKLNYICYIVFVNLFLIGIGVLIYSACKQKSLNGKTALLVAALLFNGQNLLNSTWSLSGLANIGIVFVAFLSMYLVTRKETNFTPPVNIYWLFRVSSWTTSFATDHILKW